MNTRRYRFGSFELDAIERRLVGSGDQAIALSRRVFDILVILVEAEGRLVTREDFQTKVWKDTIVEERNLTVQISTLRKALAQDSPEDYIETVPRAGYRLRVPVVVVTDERVDTPADTSPPPALPARPGWPVLQRVAVGVLLFGVALLGAYLAFGPRRAAPAGGTSSTLAVLPFSVTGLPSDAGRSDIGLTDAVISRLQQLPELTVRPTSVIKQYSAGGNLIEIGQAIDVAHVVEGIVQSEGERVRVTVKVVDVATGATRWRDVIERPVIDLFGLEEAVSVGVASALVNRLAAERSWGRPTRRPASDAAYRAYLDGKAFMLGNVDLDVSGAIASFQRAVALDPEFAPAWTALARAYRSRGYSVGGDPHAFKELSRDAVRRALAIDPTLPEAHTVLGILHYSYDWDWDAALRELRQAVALAPGSHDAQGWLGYALYTLGHFEEGMAALQRAATINPMEPRTQIAEAYWFMGRTEEALGMLQETTRLHPMHERSHWLRVFILDQAGRHDEAIAARRAAAAAIGDAAYLRELDVSIARGHRAVLEQDLRLRKARGNLGDIAWLYLQLDQPDEALAALERCADQLCNTVPVLRTESRFRPLHGDPRFQRLLRRLSLAE